MNKLCNAVVASQLFAPEREKVVSGLIYLMDVVRLHIRYVGGASFQLHHRVIWPQPVAQRCTRLSAPIKG